VAAKVQQKSENKEKKPSNGPPAIQAGQGIKTGWIVHQFSLFYVAKQAGLHPSTG
jgi:hypothetical protein